jgi:hypothetical protein
MPVVLPAELIDSWIQPNADPTVLVRASVTDMVFEKAG